MKKRVLFVIDSLNIGGGEKSLVSLLGLLDFELFDVDLLLFSRGGAFEEYVPSQVNILPSIESEHNIFNNSIIGLFKKLQFCKVFSRVRYSFAIRFFKNQMTPRNRNQFFWRCFSHHINCQKTEYDVAIAYSQGIPTYYVIDKVSSKKKIAWINGYYNLSPAQKRFQKYYYESLDHIVLVSDVVYELFSSIFPNLQNRMSIIQDICNADLLYRLSEEKAYGMETDLPKLLTVARLDRFVKGLDLSVEACKILKNRGVEFRWFVIGEGKDRTYLQNYIKDNDLGDYVFLLGAKSNPYPYFKNCDIYIQTSRREGWGISLVEARLFNRPIVTTEFSAVWNQMVQMKNGIVTDFDPEHIADALQLLINNNQVYSQIQQFQRNEKKGNKEELQKVNDLLLL